MTKEQKKQIRKRVYYYMETWYTREMELLRMHGDMREALDKWGIKVEAHARGLVDGIYFADKKFAFRMLCFLNNLKWHWQQVINREARRLRETA